MTHNQLEAQLEIMAQRFKNIVRTTALLDGLITVRIVLTDANNIFIGQCKLTELSNDENPNIHTG